MGHESDLELEREEMARSQTRQQPQSVPGRNTGAQPPDATVPGRSAPGETGREKLPGPAGDPPKVRVGEQFGTATVVRHQVLTRDGTPSQAGPGPKLVYDRYMVELKDGNLVAVDIPRTPPGGIPYGQHYNPKDASLDRKLDQAREILDGIGKMDPKLLRGTPVIDATTHGYVTTAVGTGPADGWRYPSTGVTSVTNRGLAEKGAADVLGHEGGHGIGHHLAPGKGYTDGFAEALTADGKTTAYANQFDKPELAEQHLKEAYAEAHKEYAADPDKFRQEKPAQAKIIERDRAALDRMFPKGAPLGHPGIPDPDQMPGDGTTRPPSQPGADPSHTPRTQAAAPRTPPAAPPAVAGPVASATGKVVRRVVTAAASTPVAVAESVIDVMTPGRAGPSGWHRNDRADWHELLARADMLMEDMPGLSRGDAVIKAAEEKGDPLAPHIVKDVRELDRDERAERYARGDQARAREFYEKNFSYKNLNRRYKPKPY
jgi:hypothetical protein